jgi:hypothetical protein
MTKCTLSPKHIFIPVLAGLMAITGCAKQVLSSVPLNAYTDATVWLDSGLVNLYVSNIYKGVPSEYDSYSTMLADLTDEATTNQSFGYPVTINEMQYNASTLPITFSAYWTSFYDDIRLCNTLLQKASTVPASSGLQKRWTGEAYFLRALYYHYLHNYFGAFPIVTTPLAVNDNLFIPRAADSACINLMVADLDSAAALLPLSYTGTNIGRATAGAALALKCRVLLYAGQWQAASDAAQAVVNLHVYSLFPDYEGLFYPQNDDNSEVIFAKQYTADIASNDYSDIDWGNSPTNYTGKSTGINDPNQDMVDLYEMTDGSAFDWNNPAEAARPYANRDPRFEASIMHDSTVWQGLTVNMEPGSIFNPLARPSATGYYMKKFLNPSYNYASSTTMSGQNFILIRYAEVLLNYAEAQFMLGNTGTSLAYVNMIRARPSVNMPPIQAGSFTWNSYVHERRVELAFEGLRLWDINRWKQGPQYRGSNLYGVTITGSPVHTYTRTVAQTGGTQRIFADPQSYLFPIPQTEINKYPGQSLVQNPGW